MSANRKLAADIIIVGGGLAGLSLACHLLEQGIGERRLLVLEARAEYRHDRVWCSWAQPTHPFASCIENSWTRWRVAADGREHVQSCESQPYRCIPSGRFYEEAQRRLEAASNAALQLGCAVREVRDVGEAAEVELASGEVLSASMVFDSRLPPPAGTADRAEVDWVQDFLGWHVRSEEPVFDAQTVTLMRFHASDEDVRFVYVLPFSQNEALVEATAFAPAAVADAEHEAMLHRHFNEVLGGPAYEILATERGRVPMSTRRRLVPAEDARVIPIGTAGGLVKPSTGYSFESVQLWSRAVAEHVAAGRKPTGQAPRSARALAMDRMFLAFMRRDPARMPQLFLHMFEKVAPDVLVRFLSDRSTLRDAAAVAMALPKLPMLREAMRSLRLWARSA